MSDIHLRTAVSKPPTAKTASVVIVAYHANCIDGFTSAWVVNNYLKDIGFELVLFPMSYTKESEAALLEKLHTTPHVVDLYIVDFSLTSDAIVKISNEFPWVVGYIYDHHKTAFERYVPGMAVKEDSTWSGSRGNFQVVLDNRECGASLVFKRLFPSLPEPKLISYVKDYDLWKFEYPETKAVNKYLSSIIKCLGMWDSLNKAMYTNLDYIVAKGNDLLADHDKKVKDYAATAYPIILCGLQGLATQCPREFINDVGHELAVRSTLFGAVLNLDVENLKIKLSLRSAGAVDVSSIASRYGGGGHKGAAGCEISVKDLI